MLYNDDAISLLEDLIKGKKTLHELETYIKNKRLHNEFKLTYFIGIEKSKDNKLYSYEALKLANVYMFYVIGTRMKEFGIDKINNLDKKFSFKFLYVNSNKHDEWMEGIYVSDRELDFLRQIPYNPYNNETTWSQKELLDYIYSPESPYLFKPITEHNIDDLLIVKGKI